MIAFPEVLDGHSAGQGRALVRAGTASERTDRGLRTKGPAPGGADRHVPRPDSMELESTEVLGDEIARLSAHIHAATYQLLVLIRRFDEREGWGGLSFSKVRALTRVARPETESELLELARHATAAHLERIVRGWMRVNRLEDAEGAREMEVQRHARRFLRLHPDHDGSWTIRGRLDPEVGALLEKALEWAREVLYQRTAGSREVPTEEEAVELETSPEQRLADALALVAERALAADGSEEDKEEGDRPVPVSRAERFQVVVHVESAKTSHSHVPAETPADRASSSTPPSFHVPPGPSATLLPAGTAKRLACDADLVEMTHDPKGQVLDVGRKRRTVPPAIRRALDYRDGGCRFPGCNCRYADAHHIVHWAEGGETKLENLVLLCRRHHRAVHEEGFRVEARKGTEGSGEVQFLFYRPDGRLFPGVPQAPPVPADPMADLVRGHRLKGIDPDAWTATPRWQGGRRLLVSLRPILQNTTSNAPVKIRMLG